MNYTKQTIKTVILTAAVSLGLSATALADGVIGKRYSSVELNYVDLEKGPPSVGRGITFTYNTPVSQNFDAGFIADTVRFKAAGKVTQIDTVLANATAFSIQGDSKLFVTAGLGWAFGDFAKRTEDSFVYQVGAGVEFAACTSVTVTPYVAFARTVSAFAGNEIRTGVKVAYNLTKEWDVTGRVQYNGIENRGDSVTYSLGANYRF